MKYFKVSSFFVMVVLTLAIFSSCSDDSHEVQQQKASEESFIELSMEIMEGLSPDYPDGDLIMRMSKNDDGTLQTLFSLTGESKKAARLGSSVAQGASEGGTECSNLISCGKAAEECFKQGKDALISVGPCTTYCVRCQEPQ